MNFKTISINMHEIKGLKIIPSKDEVPVAIFNLHSIDLSKYDHYVNTSYVGPIGK